MPDRVRLPAEIAEVAERQGLFIDTRSPKVLSASISVASDELLRDCPSITVLKTDILM